MTPNEVIAASRRRHRLSQRSLALRAGVTQASISRIERGLESPGFDRFGQIMLAMGERPVLGAEPIAHEVDRDELAAGRRLSYPERLREAASWNLVTARLEAAGAASRADH